MLKRVKGWHQMESKEIMQKRYEIMSERVLKALGSRGFMGYFCKDREEAAKKVAELIPVGSSVSWGGSLTLEECGIQKLLKSGNYKVIDRADAKTPKEREDALKAALTCDTYLSSVNAMTEDGIMFNIDGNGNRIAAIAYGPESVILVVGMNKICRDAATALSRAKNVAAPANSVRLKKETPCTKDGVCHDCKSPECICAQTVEMRFCRTAGRIKVLLVGEELGL